MADDVEFVARDPRQSGPDERLAEPSPRNRELRRNLLIGAVVVIGIAAFGRAVSVRHHDTKHAAPISSAAHRTVPGAVPAPAGSGLGIDLDPPLPGEAELAALARCPKAADGGSACTTSTAVPVLTAAAIRAHYGAAHEFTGHTELLRDVGSGATRIWYRQVEARVGMLTIEVIVHRRQPHDHTGASALDDGRTNRLGAVRVTAAQTVQVLVQGPSGIELSVSAAAALAGDPRARR